MPTYRVCRTFTVESGHMLSQHPESCRFPHGHTRRIEVVVVAESLDSNGMLVDFKALKLALEPFINHFDHSMAINQADPFLSSLRNQYPEEALVIFDGEPTTEAFAHVIYEYANAVLRDGFESGPYKIEAGRVRLERVRVWETPNSWAEFGE